ncbi:MAG: PAS domain-containing protein [Chloroflexia bacterium]
MRGRTLGAITLAFAESARSYNPDDLALAEDLARRAATAMDNARLYREAQTAQQRYYDLVQGIEAIVWEADPLTLRYTFVSRQAEELLGYSVERWLSDPHFFPSMLHPEDRALLGADEGASRLPGVGDDMEFRVTASDGRVLWVHASAHRPAAAPGGPDRILGLMIDITERKLAEEALLRSEANLASAQRIAHLGSWDWNVVTGQEHWSDEVYRIFGFSPRALTPSYELFMQSVHPDDREYVREADRAALIDGADYDIEFRVVRPDGEVRFVHEQAELIHDDTGRVVRMLGTALDVTEQKQAEAQRAGLLAQVERALAHRNQFLLIASHELKTPVTLLMGYGQMLRSKADRSQDEELARSVKVIVRQADRMARLIDDLMDVSRIEAGEIAFDMQVFELCSALAEVTDEVRPSQPDFEFNLVQPAGQVWVRGDRIRIQQVITNLVTNAVKYSTDRKQVDVELVREGGDATVLVRDYGLGIPDQQQSSVFRLYFRGDNVSPDNYGGLGLGLYISKNIVDRHGGDISVQSKEGVGSAFSFSLPALERSPVTA